MSQSWPLKSIGEVLALEYGKPLEDVDRKPDGAFPVYGANGEKTRTDRFYYDKLSIVVGRKGSAGELNFTESRFWPLDVTYFVTFDEQQHDLRFLYYLLSALDLPRLAKGIKPGINREEVYSLATRIPPRPDQRRIVAMLDVAFSAIADAAANTRLNIENANTVVERDVQSIFTRGNRTWEKRSLLSLCSRFVDSAHRTPRYQEEGFPALRPRDVVYGALNLVAAARVSRDEFAVQTKRYAPSPGDIVYSRELSYGWAAILPEAPTVCLSQGMCLLRPTAEIDSGYLLSVLNGPVGREQAVRAAVGAAHPHINLGAIKSYQIPLPALPVQKDIAEHIDALAIETRRLIGLYTRRLGALEMLRRSLLHHALQAKI